VQLFSALFPRFHLASSHTGLFWISTPLFLLGIVAVGWRLALRAAQSGVPLCVSILIAFFFVEYPVDLLFGRVLPGLFSNPVRSHDLFIRTFLHANSFESGFRMPSGLAGAFAVSVIALAMTDRTLPFRLTTIAVACGTLPLFKSVFIVPVGLCIGIWSIIIAIRDRSFGPLVAAAVALLIAVILSAMSVRLGFQFHLSFNPFSHGAIWTKDVLQKGFLSYAALWTAAALLCAMLYWRARHVVSPYKNPGVILLLSSLVILFLPVFVIVTYIDENGVLIEVDNAAQWFTPLRNLCTIALISAAAAQWSGLDSLRQQLIVIVVVAVSILPLAAMVKSAAMVMLEPARWHEYVDNSQIAPALRSIPREGSIVATNDLYYPANNYARDRRQFQIAGLFGHQAYGSAVRYDQVADAKERVRAQEMLMAGTWGDSHSEVARRGGWTHVLLSRRVGVIHGVPGKLIHESPAFLVYDLRNHSEHP
jgi:hypothetical protein